MVKKTWIDKSDEKLNGSENQVKEISQNSDVKITSEGISQDYSQKLTKSSLTKNGLTKMAQELLENEIPKTKIVRQTRLRRVKQRDADGNLLKQDGTIDKRVESIKKVQQKSRVYQQILENKRLKEQLGTKKVAILTPLVESDSEDDGVEFELIDNEKPLKPVEVVQPEPEPQPTIEIKRKETPTEIYLRQQELLREKQLEDQMTKLKLIEEENKNLKNKFNFNDHLNKLTHLSTSMKIRY